MRPTSLLILLLLAVGPGGAPGFAVTDGRDAEAPASETVTGVPATEDIFLAAVDASHPAWRALAGDLGSAEAARLQASLLEDPRFEVAREAPEDEARETTWGLVWTPPIDGRRRQSIRVAEAGVEVESHRLDARLLELRLEVREAYAAWAAGEARAALLVEHSDRLEALARRMRNRAAVGEESLLAARRMEIAFHSSKASLSEARAAEVAWRERAAAWLLEGELELAAMRSELPELPEAPAELGADPADSVETRPDVRAARSEVAKAESLARLSRRLVEAPELLLGWKSIDDGVAGDFEGPVFAIDWKLPIFDRRQADRRAAEASLEAAVAGEEWVTRRARSELAAALAAYRELRQSALAARGGLEELDGIARSATASFEAGESTVTDLLETLRALLEARLTALDLYAKALEAHRQLEVVSGRSLTFGDLS